ncbi:hypothetical protein [Streptomyces erythrochromogenes]|uniref:hypothetical protein n=1 Tax=Streptomyces erythrochromogenes TaxID=285574 RepID=UPI0033CB0BF9
MRPDVVRRDFHPDPATKYTTQAFTALAAACVATLKNEPVSQHRWHSQPLAHSAIFDYIEGWYNTRRLPLQPGLPRLSRTKHRRLTNINNLPAKQEQQHTNMRICQGIRHCTNRIPATVQHRFRLQWAHSLGRAANKEST